MMMNPSIDKMVQNLREQEGAHVDLKKQLADGTYDHASDKDLSLLNSKTMLLSTAQTFKDMTFHDKMKAAMDLKQRGNAFFQKGDYSAAQELYLQALTAAEFDGSGTNSSSGSKDGCVDKNSDSETKRDNVDELVVPVLCNMAACALKLNQYVKAARFCEEALRLRPTCMKALLRRGVSFLHLKEYDLSITSLEQAKEIILTSANTTSIVEEIENARDKQDVSSQNHLSKSTAADLANIEHHLLLARHARQEERQRLKQQRENLQRAFGTNTDPTPSSSSSLPPSTSTSLPSKAESSSPRNVMWQLLHRLLLWIDRFVRAAVLFLLRSTNKRHDIKKDI